MSINKKLHPISRDVMSYNYIFIVDTKKSSPTWGLMVAAHGFEPRTHRVWTDCSSQLSYAAMYGASDRDWTGDLILTKDTLCRLSYTSTMNDHFTVVFMVAGTGLEPATFGLWARRATNCSTPLWMVEGEGFEPSKSKTADLQSAPFGRSGIPP